MGANISIKEGGKARMFNAARLRTVQPGGGTVDWVLESETRTKTLYANENGTYAPAAEGVYAFDEVRVNVPEKDSFVGTGSDGNDYQYKKKGGGGGGGGGSGEIEVTKLGGRIEVTALPLNISYDEGETIDYQGLVVTAYDKNGVSMGTVPFNELILPVKTATIGAWDGSEWISNDGQIASIMVTFSLVTSQRRYLDGPILTDMNDVYDGTLGMWDGKPATIGSTNTDDQFTVLFLTRYDGNLYAMRTVGKDDFSLYAYYNNEYIDPRNWYNGWRFTGGSNYRTKTYFTGAPWDEYITNVPESLINPNNVGSEGFLQSVTIPVKWPMEGDGVELETSFSIFVKPKNMPGTSGVTP